MPLTRRYSLRRIHLHRILLGAIPQSKRFVSKDGVIVNVYTSPPDQHPNRFLKVSPSNSLELAASFDSPLSYLLATTSIAVSRVMLSIHSIAAHLGSDTAWLLNNVELSRVGWRQGATEGEIIVDRWTDDYDDDDLESTYGPAADGRTSALKMSRVGTFNDLPW